MATEPPPPSGQRRRLLRVRADLRVVVALPDGDKQSARVLDVSSGGMLLECATRPAYGDRVTVVVQFAASDWTLLPATVRWFGVRGFGVAFGALDERQAVALERFISAAAA